MSQLQDSRLDRRLLLAARVAAILTLGTVATLFSSAGVLVQDGTGLNIHGTAALTIHILTGLLALTLAVRAWVSRVGLWAAVAAVVVFGLTFAQAVLGSRTTLAFHIGGSLVIAVTCTWLTAWTFRPRRSLVDAPG